MMMMTRKSDIRGTEREGKIEHYEFFALFMLCAVQRYCICADGVINQNLPIPDSVILYLEDGNLNVSRDS